MPSQSFYQSFALALLSAVFAFNAQAQECGCLPYADRTTVVLTDNTGSGTGTQTLSCDNIYLLDGFVYVNEGDVLTIEPGTVIQAKAGQGASASCLIVARGAQILADGTASCPIIFTYEGDPLNGSTPYNTRGLWGGVIVNGYGILNTYDGDDVAEGIMDPSNTGRDVYGGEDNAGSSGIMRHISIRHGGSEMPNPPVNFQNKINGDETNGLSLNGVGSGTIIEHIEVVSTLDDGLQIMGGSANIKYLAVAFSSEDNIEYDQGWVGDMQFFFSVLDQPEEVGELGFDFEGDDFEFQDVTLSFLPYTNPQIANFTNIGHPGAGALRWHNGAGGRVYNGIFQNWDYGIDFEDEDPCDAYELFLFGELEIHNNRFWNVGDSLALDTMILYEGPVWNGNIQIQNHFVNNNNAASDAGIDDQFEALAGFITSGLDLFPNEGDSVPAEHQPVGTFFDPVNYVGAFEPGGENWLTGSYLDQLGMFYPGDVPGCMYSWACNYDADANKDDGSCDVSTCGGCKYAEANNFNAGALFDDGSCTFPAGESPCPSDVDGDGTTGVNDLLEVLSLFGASCG
ncbi:MAG: hypothetical protein L7S67_02115 [Flavobacteriales bacterium]|nr:hypothetical protein [Flavobacteriales bacterium]